MKLVVSAKIQDSRNRELMVEQIKLLGYIPKVKGRAVTVTVSGHFVGSFISLVGLMDGYEITQEGENETENDIEHSSQGSG